MIDKKIFTKYKNQWINVGVSNKYNPDNLWFHSGKLTELTDDYLVITNKFKELTIELDVIKFIDFTYNSSGKSIDDE